MYSSAGRDIDFGPIAAANVNSNLKFLSFRTGFIPKESAVDGSAIEVMATQTATFPAQTVPTRNELLLPAFTLWWREVVRFYRQRSRVVGVIASPIVFWLVIGSGFGTSFRSAGPNGLPYLDYFYPGAMIMIVLFTSIFTMMSVIEDRKEGFLLSVLVAPVSRSAIVLGKVLGGTTLATIQGLIFLAFAPLVDVHLTIATFLLVVLTVFLVSFALTALGFVIAWPMDSTQAFHAIINLFLIPLWLLSGAMFPLSGASVWLRVVMRINPLTYGVEALRSLLYPASVTEFSIFSSLATLVLFSLFMFGLAFVMVNRRTTKSAA
jgi:ABC-2 type transport system permease protein